MLRQLAGVKPGKVKDWMAEHDSELSAYADELGHGSRQNVGKPEVRSVVKWSEAAYGAFEEITAWPMRFSALDVTG